MFSIFNFSFQEDEKFLRSLFDQLVDEETDDGKRRDLVFFLKEFCTFSQILQPASRDTFFKVCTGFVTNLETLTIRSPGDPA